jgi:hypothetical protein
LDNFAELTAAALPPPRPSSRAPLQSDAGDSNHLVTSNVPKAKGRQVAASIDRAVVLPSILRGSLSALADLRDSCA